jgi:S-adenosylmethionine hydrolase
VKPLITLTTDFGLTGHYVAQMKGVILALNPAAQIVDITHAIAPQNIRQGAIALRDATPFFPTGSIHVAVIDPGVGTARKILYAEIAGRHYIAPDNGLLWLVACEATPSRLISIENRSFMRCEVSSTFHGRDIMAPAAAQLSLSVDPAELGPTVSSMQPLAWPEPVVTKPQATGQIVDIDAFGNAITNLRAKDLPLNTPQQRGQAVIQAGQRRIEGLHATYGEGESGEFIALVGSSGYLELACVGGSAAERFSLGVGEGVTVTWPA